MFDVFNDVLFNIIAQDKEDLSNSYDRVNHIDMFQIQWIV